MGTTAQERWTEQQIADFQDKIMGMLRRVDTQQVLGPKVKELIVSHCTHAVLDEIQKTDHYIQCFRNGPLHGQTIISEICGSHYETKTSAKNTGQITTHRYAWKESFEGHATVLIGEYVPNKPA